MQLQKQSNYKHQLYYRWHLCVDSDLSSEEDLSCVLIWNGNNQEHPNRRRILGLLYMHLSGPKTDCLERNKGRFQFITRTICNQWEMSKTDHLLSKIVSLMNCALIHLLRIEAYDFMAVQNRWHLSPTHLKKFFQWIMNSYAQFF
jgi:hypothetical protein